MAQDFMSMPGGVGSVLSLANIRIRSVNKTLPVIKLGLFSFKPNHYMSSVLNRDAREYGKKHMFDDNSDTCWNSDQGTPQWIHLDFHRPVSLKEMHIQFQGGFAGKECSLEGQLHDHNELVRLQNFYPEDANSLQVFPIQSDIALKNLRIMFNNSTDFFGRVIIYKLEVIGEPE